MAIVIVGQFSNNNKLGKAYHFFCHASSLDSEHVQKCNFSVKLLPVSIIWPLIPGGNAI